MESILSITGKLVYLAVFVGGIVFLLNLFFPDLLQKTEKEEVEKDLPVDVPEQTETVEKHEERQEIDVLQTSRSRTGQWPATPD